MPVNTFDMNDLIDPGDSPREKRSATNAAKAKATMAEQEQWAESQVGCKAADQVMVIPPGGQVINYSVSDAAIAEMRDAYLPLTITDPNDAAGFKAVHSARMVVKGHRIDVEKLRKELKAAALEYGRRVDGEAKRITALLEPIEEHLAMEEDAYNAEKDRIKNAERLQAEAEATAAKAAEEARLKAEQDAENERLRIAREALEAERKAMEEAQAAERARQKAEQDKIDAANRAIEIEKKRLADIEAARLRKIEDERIAAEAAERSRIETEARIARQAAEKAAADKRAAEQAEAARLADEQARARAEALRPDAEKLLAVAAAVAAIEIPEVSAAAKDIVRHVRQTLADAETKIKAIVASMGMV